MQGGNLTFTVRGVGNILFDGVFGVCLEHQIAFMNVCDLEINTIQYKNTTAL